ncbi:MFS transporter [Candidatus Nitronereus thalassa]|uniref:MFS transporter n=1 Tax=Candidatus Nitronereus thalassa TaxID=3020898 RepID=A0ABU3K6R5_9BACT|nr:MFS transporter [Candidatus Nitronereus thalassa]MDT7042066.1 MFS transporter [Candidatus Nitronereus thalassa]
MNLFTVLAQIMREPIPTSQSPTNARWIILALLLLISIITYIDRVNISITARQMMPALGLTNVQMGQIFSAFVFGYALFQIPGGWMGDRWGARKILTLAVIWWSIFTALTALAPASFLSAVLGIWGSLIVVRFLIGMGEAAALPNFTRAVANWCGPHERGIGMAITISGIGIGSALTPPITAWIMVNYGWQTAFYLAGAIGIVIALIWYWFATDFPQDHPWVNAQEAALIQGKEPSHPTPSPSQAIPWKIFAKTPTVWWLVLSYTCFGYVAYVYMSWFYLYLVEARGFSVLRGAVFASSPFIAMTIFCPLGGWFTDQLSQRFGLNKGRSWIGITGMTLAALSIILGALIDTPFIAIAFLSLGAGWLYFTIGAFWSTPVDLSKSHAGTLSGLMNTGANLGGTLSPTFTPWIANQYGWTVSLGVAAALALIGALAWLKIRPGDGLRE